MKKKLNHLNLSGPGQNWTKIVRAGPSQNFYFYFGPGRAEISVMRARHGPEKSGPWRPLFQILFIYHLMLEFSKGLICSSGVKLFSLHGNTAPNMTHNQERKRSDYL